MKQTGKMIKRLMVPPDTKVRLKNHSTKWTGGLTKARAKKVLAEGVGRLSEQQERLYAQDEYALLLIFQAMDAAGKDSTIRHVMSGVNPQGCEVYSFKAPSTRERDQTYLQRSMEALPERGRIGIHNRSYYEEVLIVRVHKEIIASAKLPENLKGKGIWKRRFREINDFERYLHENGTVVLKFFLHVSKGEQKRRFLERIDREEKNWKFSADDVKERAHWDEYMDAYEEMLSHTSTKDAPWFIIPSDHKWFCRVAVAEIIGRTLEDLDLQFPKVTQQKKKELLEARALLLSEEE